MPTNYSVLPIPAFPEFTRTFDAGPVTFGVEYRLLDENAIREAYGDDAREQFGNVTPPGLPTRIEEDGVSVHVFGSEDRREYLRFDCFGDFPHYHYIVAREGHQSVMEFDPIADGPIVPWMLKCLRARLPMMLERAGAADLAEKVEPRALDRVLEAVEQEVAAAIERGKPTRFEDASSPL